MPPSNQMGTEKSDDTAQGRLIVMVAGHNLPRAVNDLVVVGIWVALRSRLRLVWSGSTTPTTFLQNHHRIQDGVCPVADGQLDVMLPQTGYPQSTRWCTRSCTRRPVLPRM